MHIKTRTCSPSSIKILGRSSFGKRQFLFSIILELNSEYEDEEKQVAKAVFRYFAVIGHKLFERFLLLPLYVHHCIRLMPLDPHDLYHLTVRFRNKLPFKTINSFSTNALFGKCKIYAVQKLSQQIEAETPK